jgi:hypothetical protein
VPVDIAKIEIHIPPNLLPTIAAMEHRAVATSRTFEHSIAAMMQRVRRVELAAAPLQCHEHVYQLRSVKMIG